MVALSRLKATFEACLGLFCQNMKTLVANREGVACRNRADGWGAPSDFQRCTRYSTLVHKSNFGLGRMHGRGLPQSVCLTHAGNLVLKPRREQVFSGSDGGLVMQRIMDICDVCAWCHSLVSPQVKRWPCGYCPSIQSRSSFDVPCHCSFTQPNTCILSLASTAAGIPLS